jgi:hypothetical protein
MRGFLTPLAAFLAVAVAGALLAGCDAASSIAARAGLVASFESRCEKSLPPTRIDIVVIPVVWNTDRTRSVDELTRLSGDSGDVNRALGLTTAQVGHQAFVETAGIEDTRSGRTCVRPSIRVELAMTPMTLYVSREFAGDPCREAAIVEHEMKHVTVYTNYLSTLADDVGKTLRAEYGNKVFRYDGRADARRETEARLLQQLHELLADNAGRIKELQATVDSPEEYARVALACGGMQAVR